MPTNKKTAFYMTFSNGQRLRIPLTRRARREGTAMAQRDKLAIEVSSLRGQCAKLKETLAYQDRLIAWLRERIKMDAQTRKFLRASVKRLEKQLRTTTPELRNP